MHGRKKYSIVPMRDPSDKYGVKKETIFDLPARVCWVGKSQLSGKTTHLASLLCFPDFYTNEFKGDNIYIVSNSVNQPKYKMVRQYKDIPDENCFKYFDEDVVSELYDLIEELFRSEVDDGEKPQNRLVVFDDVAWDGSLRKKHGGVIDKIFCQGRHINLSCFCLAQKYTQLSTCMRENLSGLVCFACSTMQLEHIINDHNTGSSKKAFIQAFHGATKEPHSTFVCNYSNPSKTRFMKGFTEPLSI